MTTVHSLRSTSQDTNTAIFVEATKCIFSFGGLLSFHPLPNKVMEFIWMAPSPLALGDLDFIIANIFCGPTKRLLL